MISRDQLYMYMSDYQNVDLSVYDSDFLDRSLEKHIKLSGWNSIDDFFEQIVFKPDEISIFFESLHIGYTEFFRNPLTFVLLEYYVLPELIQRVKDGNRHEIRIWSAACGTGQEVYSLAILMNELIANQNSKISFRIFGSDINKSHLKTAQKGIYQKSSLNNINFKQLNKWFIPHDDHFIINPELRQNISFSQFNLLDKQLYCPQASIFGDFDLILCCNVLFYFTPDVRDFVVSKFGYCLSKNSYLVTGEVEREILLNQQYKEAFTNSAIFYSKLKL